MNLITLMLLQTAAAADLTVDPSGSGAYSTVQSAIDASVSGDVIILMAGTYNENILVESKSINIQGMDPDARDTTRIVGTGSGTVASIVGGIVNISDLTISGGEQGMSITTNAVSELNNLVIENNVGSEMGGGLHIASNADVVLTDLLVQDNEALQGGGIHLATSAKRLSISGTTIRGNNAGETGGGVFASSSLSMGTTWISDNTAASAGGGLYATLISPQVDDCRFWGNNAENGGGIALESTTTSTFFANRVKGTEFWLNNATNNGGALWLNGAGEQFLKEDLLVLNVAGADGGGLWATGGQPNLTFVRAWYNEAAGIGGGALLNGSNGGKTRKSSFGGNIAGDYGGGAVHMSSNTSHPVVNNRYIENEAPAGAGLVINGDILKYNIVTNVDIVGNIGDGITFVESPSAKLENSIIAFNDGTGIVADETSTNEYLKLKYNNVYGNGTDYGDGPSGLTDTEGTGDGNISADPVFVRFAVDGDPISDFLYPSDGSPVIDVGRPEVAYLDTDGSPSDMGSYGGPEAESRDSDCGEVDDATCRYDEDGDGYDPAQGDCDDGDALVAPGLEEIPGDGRDNDCAGGRDIDIDGDGFISPIDCDDTNPDIYPGAEDIEGDGVDADCNGSDGDLPPQDDTGMEAPGADTGSPWVDQDTDTNTDPYDDADRDGFYDEDDCDDSAPDINPDADEKCNDGIDNDCDGKADSEDEDCAVPAETGCGCTTVGNPNQAWLGLLMLGLLMRRRRHQP